MYSKRGGGGNSYSGCKADGGEHDDLDDRGVSDQDSLDADKPPALVNREETISEDTIRSLGYLNSCGIDGIKDGVE